MNTNQITKTEDVKSFFNELNSKFGLSWHPDDEFEEKEMNTLMNKCFEYCTNAKIDIYEIALDCSVNIRSQFGIGTEIIN
jgi:hypothetical protein